LRVVVDDEAKVGRSTASCSIVVIAKLVGGVSRDLLKKYE